MSITPDFDGFTDLLADKLAERPKVDGAGKLPATVLPVGTAAGQVKPGDWTPPDAAVATKGIVQLATTEEATTGTDTEKAVTPAAARTATVTLGDGRYRRVLSELRALAPGADVRPLVQAALADAGGMKSELVLPDGDFSMTSATDSPGVYASAIKISTSDTTLRGAGIGKTRIFGGPLARNLIGIGTEGPRISNCTVSDLTLEGNGSSSNQRGVAVQYADHARVSRVRVLNMGNNGINVQYADHAELADVDISGSNDFGILFYRAAFGRVIDAYVHDIGNTRNHLGLQFKNSKHCHAIRPRIQRVQGYGFYTWDDGLDSVNYPDVGHTLEEAFITDALPGGGFAPINCYINLTPNVRIVGGRFIESNKGVISCNLANDLTIEGISELTGAHDAPALSINGGSFRVSGVTANGRGVSNELGLTIQGSPVRGTVRNSSFINGAAGASLGFNAAARVEPSVSGCFFEHNDFSDYQATKTQRRGIFDRTEAGVNYWRFNKAIGNTSANKVIPVGSIDLDNITA